MFSFIYWPDLTRVITLGEFNRCTDHGGQNGVRVLRRRVSALLQPLCEILFVTKHL